MENKKTFSLRNIVDAPITSLIGILLVAAGIATVFMHNITWAETLFPVTSGVILLVAPDKIVDIIKKKLEK